MLERIGFQVFFWTEKTLGCSYEEVIFYLRLCHKFSEISFFDSVLALTFIYLYVMHLKGLSHEMVLAFDDMFS